MLTDPITGHPTDLGRTTHRPPAALDEFVRIRDRECRTPGCYRPTQVSELDHTTDWHKHGTTTEKRLIGLCRHHHTLKDHPGWTYTANDTDGTYTRVCPGFG